MKPCEIFYLFYRQAYPKDSTWSTTLGPPLREFESGMRSASRHARAMPCEPQTKQKTISSHPRGLDQPHGPVTEIRPQFASTSSRRRACRSGRPCATCTARCARSAGAGAFSSLCASDAASEECTESSSFQRASATAGGAASVPVTKTRIAMSTPGGARSSAVASVLSIHSTWPGAQGQLQHLNKSGRGRRRGATH